MDIFIDDEKERLIVTITECINKYPVSVEDIIDSIKIIGKLESMGIDHTRVLKSITPKEEE